MAAKLTLSITRLQASVYRADIAGGGVSVVDSLNYTSIEDAIVGTARGTPDGFADFYELRYNGLTTGTFAIAELLVDAPKHAAALVALEARVDAA